MCDHLNSYKESEVSANYSVFFEACISNQSSRTKTLKPSCFVCKKYGPRARVHACMSCPVFGCLQHLNEHKSKEQHKLAMDLVHGAIYCLECQDYVYDEYFSSEARRQLQLAGRKKETFHDVPWLSTEEIKLSKHYKFIEVNQSPIGLRGLTNMGFTCYINCIIQVFAHTPMMRNYFFSGRHKCSKKTTENPECPACLLSKIYQELYSGKEDPLRLEELIVNLWTNHWKTFAGKNKPSDAYDFYDLFLEDLHLSEDNSRPCRCVIHQIFSGYYEYVENCTLCGRISSQILQSWSITLDPSDGIGEIYLTDCIKKSLQTKLTTKPNKEDATKLDQLICDKCNSGSRGTQIFIKALPNILCFHNLNGVGEPEEEKRKDVKSKTKVVFPEFLNMSAYTRESSRSETYENGTHISGPSHEKTSNLYILYAVVCHIGNVSDGGHFYSYIRKGVDTWYYFNDDKIEEVDFQLVSECSGYLFFYIKEVLEYEELKEKEPRSQNEKNSGIQEEESTSQNDRNSETQEEESRSPNEQNSETQEEESRSPNEQNSSIQKVNNIQHFNSFPERSVRDNFGNGDEEFFM